MGGSLFVLIFFDGIDGAGMGFRVIDVTRERDRSFGLLISVAAAALHLFLGVLEDKSCQTITSLEHYVWAMPCRDQISVWASTLTPSLDCWKFSFSKVLERHSYSERWESSERGQGWATFDANF